MKKVWAAGREHALVQGDSSTCPLLQPALAGSKPCMEEGQDSARSEQPRPSHSLFRLVWERGQDEVLPLDVPVGRWPRAVGH